MRKIATADDVLTVTHDHELAGRPMMLEVLVASVGGGEGLTRRPSVNEEKNSRSAEVQPGLHSPSVKSSVSSQLHTVHTRGKHPSPQLLPRHGLAATIGAAASDPAGRLGIKMQMCRIFAT